MNKKTQLRMTVREFIYEEMKWPALHELDDNENLADQGIESLKAITILYKLEDELGIEIPNETMDSCQTVSDIVSNITVLLGDRNG